MKGGAQKCFGNQVNLKKGDENVSAATLIMKGGGECFGNQVI
jgi:hypothetical protein